MRRLPGFAAAQRSLAHVSGLPAALVASEARRLMSNERACSGLRSSTHVSGMGGGMRGTYLLHTHGGGILLTAHEGVQGKGWGKRHLARSGRDGLPVAPAWTAPRRSGPHVRSCKCGAMAMGWWRQRGGCGPWRGARRSSSRGSGRAYCIVAAAPWSKSPGEAAGRAAAGVRAPWATPGALNAGSPRWDRHLQGGGVSA